MIAQQGDTAPTSGPWTEPQIRKIKDRVKSFGLKIGIMMLHDFRDVILGRPGRDAAIENVQKSVRIAGRAGIPVVEYNFYAVRAMGGYYKSEGRGGSIYSTYDADRNRDLKTLPDVGEHSESDLWERYTYFLKAVIPIVPSSQEVPVKEAIQYGIYTNSLRHLPIQRKLSIGAIDDPLEEEADAMADKVMRILKVLSFRKSVRIVRKKKKCGKNPLPLLFKKNVRIARKKRKHN